MNKMLNVFKKLFSTIICIIKLLEAKKGVKTNRLKTNFIFNLTL